MPLSTGRFSKNVSEVLRRKNGHVALVGIDWNGLGFKNLKLEELVLKSGYFYEAHRACIDCLALAWLLHCQPDAFASLLNGRKRTVTCKLSVRLLRRKMSLKPVLTGGTTGQPVPTVTGGKKSPKKSWRKKKRFWTSCTPTVRNAAQGFLTKQRQNASRPL